jgi:hypothetical protein
MKRRGHTLQILRKALSVAVITAAFPILGAAQSDRDNASRHATPNLSGLWLGEGYTCDGREPPEEVRIEQRGEQLTAIKTAGDRCILTGEITWRGTFGANTFPIQFHVTAGVGSASRSFINGTARLENADTLVVSTAHFTVTFRRKPAGEPPKITFLRKTDKGFETVANRTMAVGDRFKVQVDMKSHAATKLDEFRIKLRRNDGKSKDVVVRKTGQKPGVYHSDVYRVENETL